MSAQSKAGIVNIHGKEYKTVALRVDEFRKDYKDEWAIITKIAYRDENIVIMEADILNKENRVIATGFAEEDRRKGTINSTSALENCETSAIGRALANLGYGGGEYASADEVANAVYQQNASGERKSYGGLDFDTIREELKAIDDEKSVIDYAKGIGEKIKNPTEKQAAWIKKMASDRIKEIRGEL